MERFVRYNAHPKGLLTNDCVVRAISKATGKDYMLVRRELNEIKRSIGSDSYKYKGIYEKYVGGIRIKTMSSADRTRMTGSDFASKYREGSYLLKMAGHLTACVDGIIYDTWDCSDKMVYFAIKVTGEKK